MRLGGLQHDAHYVVPTAGAQLGPSAQARADFDQGPRRAALIVQPVIEVLSHASGPRGQRWQWQVDRSHRAQRRGPPRQLLTQLTILALHRRSFVFVVWCKRKELVALLS